MRVGMVVLCNTYILLILGVRLSILSEWNQKRLHLHEPDIFWDTNTVVFAVCCLGQKVENTILFKYYISGHYPSSCFYLKHRPVYISKHNVSEAGFCLGLQIKPTQVGPIDRASPCLRKESGLWNAVFWNINRTMNNAQKRNICTNVTSSQIFRSYSQFCWLSGVKNIAIARNNSVCWLWLMMKRWRVTCEAYKYIINTSAWALEVLKWTRCYKSGL
jgi:hypothetical protein